MCWDLFRTGELVSKGTEHARLPYGENQLVVYGHELFSLLFGTNVTELYIYLKCYCLTSMEC